MTNQNMEVKKTEELYQEMRNLALKLKKHTENELIEKVDCGTLELNRSLKIFEEQDKNFNQDLELENFYLAIRLLLMNKPKHF